MTALKTQPKFDLSGIDPDHWQWLEQEAHAHKMSVSDLLLAERAGKIDLRPSYHERKDRPDDLAKSIGVTLTISDPKLRMAFKRHAARQHQSVEEYVADCALCFLIGCETEYEADVLTGRFTNWM